MENKKISFCIVCRNRLEHLKQTLIRNIQDNILNDIEFVLLDYNSSDGLEEWIKMNLQEYLKRGIFVFYKNTTAPFFHRSHSRNMAIRLSKGDIICNLDADNYLGKGFASYILDLFKNNSNIFVTSDYNKRDVIGRVCVKKKDFLTIRGYNELLGGYGFEDVELYHRLQKQGLQQYYSPKVEFFKAINHSNKMRISQEELYSEQYQLYIHYITPFLSDFLLLYQDYSFIKGKLRNNFNLLFNDANYEKLDKNARAISDHRRIILPTPIEKGIWISKEKNQVVCVSRNSTQRFKVHSNQNLSIEGRNLFYRISDEEVCDLFMVNLSEAINYSAVLKSLASKDAINPQSFGTGFVYKNFNSTETIQLS